ncbi:hypothetical protein Rleg9DRAFT_6836 [Rhizobium leguminosarum bv. trifolii WSM597]|uniref:Uncharacterized protein n=2 Tax=Rhizobium leguminosarum bv. trifolii TaxID=386 RepID=A0ABF7QNA7_RHILW|nr:hypothetical protein Rleg2_2310 [Rhizobium leguminosarum bv. trifolii WSM2304]EJB07815.1 hypothetical protein Rleg9DRAFT_6836 [Rhizobium leguminosarum bv. trifolii WSM597]
MRPDHNGLDSLATCVKFSSSLIPKLEVDQFGDPLIGSSHITTICEFSNSRKLVF